MNLQSWNIQKLHLETELVPKAFTADKALSALKTSQHSVTSTQIIMPSISAQIVQLEKKFCQIKLAAQNVNMKTPV